MGDAGGCAARVERGGQGGWGQEQLRSREEADFVGVAKSRANLPRAAEMSFMLILGSQLRARGSIKRGTQAEA